VLVNVIGISGAFTATLLGSLILVPALARASTKEVGLSVTAFAKEAIAPLLLPLLAMAAVVGAVVLAPFGNLMTILVAAPVGAVVYLTLAVRFAVGREELSVIRQSLRRGPGPGTEPPT